MLNKFFNVFIILVFFISKNNAVHSQTEKKPNVLILFSDQHNKKTMGFENHPDVITPNLDQFSEESVVFDRAYATRGHHDCPNPRPGAHGLEHDVISDVISVITKYNAVGHGWLTK